VHFDDALPFMTVEFYTPGEMIEGCRSFNVETFLGAIAVSQVWLDASDEAYISTRFRILDEEGKTLANPCRSFLMPRRPKGEKCPIEVRWLRHAPAGGRA
jgi:hypothetical protein